jgi:hypothetical protein
MTDQTAPSPGGDKGKQTNVLKPATTNTSTSSRSSHRDSLTLAPAPSSPRLNANRSSSLTENFRHTPLSPRTQRAPSMSQAAIQDMINDPPTAKSRGPTFVGRDWKSIQVEEVVDKSHVRFVDTTTSVEKATEVRELGFRWSKLMRPRFLYLPALQMLSLFVMRMTQKQPVEPSTILILMLIYYLLLD